MNINGIATNDTTTDRTFNILFLQEYNKEYDYDDTLLLKFTKIANSGYVDFINDRINTSVRDTRIKIKIELNLTYKYTDASYAPRFRFNVYRNSSVVTSRYCGTTDSTDDPNTLRIDLIIDVLHNDEILIELSKDTAEDSTNKITIVQNSYIIFKNI